MLWPGRKINWEQLVDSEARRRRLRRMGREVLGVYDALGLGFVTAPLQKYFQDPITERLKALDEAKANLSVAMDAIEELRAEAEDNARSLESLTKKLNAAAEHKTLLAGEVDTLRQLSALDAAAVRKALGIPSRRQVWLQHAVAFALGILGSMIATWVWQLFPFGG